MTETACAGCDSGALPRRTTPWVREDGDYFRRFGGGAVIAEAGNGGEDDGVAVARDHPPDGAPPYPAFCCPERPAGSTTSNAPAIIQRDMIFPSLSPELHHISSNISSYLSPIDPLKRTRNTAWNMAVDSGATAWK